MRWIASVIVLCVGSLCLAQAQVPMTGAGKGVPGGGGGGGGTGTAPLLDVASGSNFGTASATNTVSNAAEPLSTSGTNRIIVVTIASSNDTTTPPNFTSVVGTGQYGITLTLHRRIALFNSGSIRGAYHGNLEVWWGVAPAQISVTPETFTATTVGGVNFDNAVLIVAAYSGCNTTNPWDPNASLATAQATGQEGTNAVVTGASITNNGTLGVTFGMNLSNAGLGGWVTPSGWASIPGDNVPQNHVNAVPWTDGGHTTPLSSTFNFTSTSSAPPFGDWALMLDALTS